MSALANHGAAIVGVGRTELSKDSGRSILSLATEATEMAVADAGLSLNGDLDGLATFGLNDTVPPQAVATALGLPRLRWFCYQNGGGDACCSIVGSAALAVLEGLAETVVVYRAMNGRSEVRLGETGKRGAGEARFEAQYTYPFGWMAYAQYIAMAARRHMVKYGTTSEDFAHVAVTCRDHAVSNPRAMKREPISIEDHLDSRMVVDPFRLLDICLESDGACALAVTTAERARSLPRPPVYISACATGGGRRPGYFYDGFFTWDDLADLYGQFIASDLYRAAGVTPQDIDVASIYDCFTFSVISQLEGFGFCKPGEGGAFVRDGNIGVGGELPVNPHGGLLSEGYVHGFNGIAEMVDQLQGRAAGKQVKDAEVALATGFGCTTGSALVLTR